MNQPGKAVQEQPQGFNEVLETIRKDANRDLYLDEEHIDAKFNIPKMIDNCSPQEKETRRQAIRRIINEAYIARELKQRGRLSTGEKNDVTLLRHLGYPIQDNSPYFDKETVYGIVLQIAQDQLSEERLAGPLTNIKSLIKKCGLKARLQVIGIAEELQIDKFQAAKQAYEKIEVRLIKEQESEPLVLPKEFPAHQIPVNLKHAITPSFEQSKTRVTKSLLGTAFKRMMPYFKDSPCSLDEFRGYLDNDVNTYINENMDKLKTKWKDLQPANKPTKLLMDQIQFFTKWSPYIVAELVQGSEDEQEALVDGVCWAVCQHLMLYIAKHPKCTLEY